MPLGISSSVDLVTLLCKGSGVRTSFLNPLPNFFWKNDGFYDTRQARLNIRSRLGTF